MEGIFQQNSSLFRALFSRANEELEKFDSIESLLDMLRYNVNEGLSKLFSILNVCALCIRMHVVAQRDPSLLLVISEDCLQRVLMMLQTLVAGKFVVFASDDCASPKVSKQISQRKGYNPIIACIPKIAMFLETMMIFVQHVKPSGMVGTLLMEVAILILRNDTYIHVSGIAMDNKLRANVAYAQRAAIGLLSAIYQHHKSFRMDITASLTQCIQSSFTSKYPVKLFPVSLSSSPDDIIYISGCTVCLLTCSTVCVDESSETDNDIMSRHYKPCAIFATDLVQVKFLGFEFSSCY